MEMGSHLTEKETKIKLAQFIETRHISLRVVSQTIDGELRAPVCQTVSD